MNRDLVEFYTSDGKDHAGRTHTDILAFDNNNLERTHDFIQWIFPTVTESAYNEDAPILDDETIEALKSNQAFRTRFFQSVGRILRFLDISYTVDEHENIHVEPITHTTHWMDHDNHNLLRMSRMMQSARLLGFDSLAKTLFEALLGIVGNRRLHVDTGGGSFISSENVYHWYKAAFGKEI